MLQRNGQADNDFWSQRASERADGRPPFSGFGPESENNFHEMRMRCTLGPCSELILRETHVMDVPSGWYIPNLTPPLQEWILAVEEVRKNSTIGC